MWNIFRRVTFWHRLGRMKKKLYILLSFIVVMMFTYMLHMRPFLSTKSSLRCPKLGISKQSGEYYPCEDEVYCYGPLLHAAQYSYLYNDSKTFVDMHMKCYPDKVLKDFDILLNETNDEPSMKQKQDFVLDHFTEPGSEFEKWTPADWKESPNFLNRIQNSNLKSWAIDLNARWLELGRKIKDDVKANSSEYSIICSKNPIVVPGGRFREFFYWDNYWIIRGLLLSEMFDTVKGSIKNFLDMVKEYGYIPNGGRIYFTRRSQTPFLSLMVRDYVNWTGDYEFMEEALPILEHEYSFWERNRTVSIIDSRGNSYFLSRYASDVNQPRPESYREDYDLIHDNNLDEAAQLELMMHVTSACESGWDFSSRWTGFCHENSNESMLLNMRTRDVIPVDLNSILSAVEVILADFNQRLGMKSKAEMYLKKRHQRIEAMEKYLWNEDDGTYYDYILSQNAQNRQFFISNMNPVWTKAYASYVNVDERESKMYQYLKTQRFKGVGVLDFPGGIPASLTNSGHQWDFPNAWPPTVHMLIEGFHSSHAQRLKDEAFRQAQKWIRTAWKGFNNSDYNKPMFEKYNVLRDDGLPGTGGEYEVQEGFGWTNGVAMSLLNLYGDKLTI